MDQIYHESRDKIEKALSEVEDIESIGVANLTPELIKANLTPELIKANLTPEI